MYIICISVICALLFLVLKIDSKATLEDYDSWNLLGVESCPEDESSIIIRVETPCGVRTFLCHADTWVDLDTEEHCSTDETCTLIDLLYELKEKEDDYEQSNRELWKPKTHWRNH
jgi:hypothetical protein